MLFFMELLKAKHIFEGSRVSVFVLGIVGSIRLSKELVIMDVNI